jgi:surfactin synthase thioesterase subunit
MAALARTQGEGAEIVHRLTPARERAALSVICVPYAAGDGIVYQTLADHAPREVALYSVTNPRSFDPADPAQVEAFVERCVAEIGSKIDGPIAVWGHCVGYALALVLARRLPDVRALFIGGVVIDPDHAEQRHGEAGEVVRDEVVSLLTSAGLTEVQGALREDEWDLVARKFEHDMRLSQALDARFFREGARLPIPVTCVVASDDPLTPDARAAAENWRMVSESLRVVDLGTGGHYFLHTRARQVAELLGAVLQPPAPRAQPSPTSSTSA